MMTRMLPRTACRMMMDRPAVRSCFSQRAISGEDVLVVWFSIEKFSVSLVACYSVSLWSSLWIFFLYFLFCFSRQVEVNDESRFFSDWFINFFSLHEQWNSVNFSYCYWAIVSVRLFINIFKFFSGADLEPLEKDEKYVKTLTNNLLTGFCLRVCLMS